MTGAPTDIATVVEATHSGRLCAISGRGQRDLHQCATKYADLFPAGPFDQAFFSTVALANTFCAPWLSADQISIANRSSLWAFALDREIDHLATTSEQVDDLARRCLLVADNEAFDPDDLLSAFLAEVRDQLATAPGYGRLRKVWRDELRRMLAAMRREWTWKTRMATGGKPPTFGQYLRNTENFGFSFVYASHLAYTASPVARPVVESLRAACREVQRVMRLLNDLGTYERDLAWGDLNALMLGLSREDVMNKVAELTSGCRDVLGPLKVSQPKLAGFLERHMDFNLGFYLVSDYIGTP